MQLGCCVLTTMAMQSLLRGFASEAMDMAHGAFERAKGHASPRVLAFTHQAHRGPRTRPRQRPHGGIPRPGRIRGPPRPGGLDLGNRSLDILARVQCSRAKDYVREFTDALAPWRREPAVRDFLHRARTELSIAA